MRMPTALPPAEGRRFDVVGFGLNMTDLLVVVERFPRPDSKQSIRRHAYSPGGQAASAMVACARLGWRARYVGCFGDDENGRRGLSVRERRAARRAPPGRHRRRCRSTAERLVDWHASLLPTGRSGMRRIAAGRWRGEGTDPMQVVSDPIGRERVHFEAPAAARVDARCGRSWTGSRRRPMPHPVLRAGLAHLWFVTVHPFEDGNGRIARAVADMALARSEGSPQRFYSMSSQIRAERAAYYDVLERTQRGATNITIGSRGSSAASAGRSTRPGPRWPPCSRRRGSGSARPVSP